MVLHVQCPHCGGVYQVADDQAGSTATCPECHTLARIPAVNAPQAASAPAGPPPASFAGPQHAAGLGAPSPPQGPQVVSTDTAARRLAAEGRIGFHLRLVGILSLIMAALCLMWAGLCLLASFALRDGAFPIPPEFRELQDPVLRQAIVVFCLVVGLLSLANFAGLLVSGICVLARRGAARPLGLFVAALNCASLWQYFLYPLCLGLGIYSLVVLWGQDARLLLSGPPGYFEAFPRPGSGSVDSLG